MGLGLRPGVIFFFEFAKKYAQKVRLPKAVKNFHSQYQSLLAPILHYNKINPKFRLYQNAKAEKRTE